MRVCAVDLSSTRSGVAFFEKARTGPYTSSTSYSLQACCACEPKESKVTDQLRYPWSFIERAHAMARKVVEVVKTQLLLPDVIVVEETNLGKQRYSQKVLEWTHCFLLQELKKLIEEENSSRGPWTPSVVYVSSSTWRKALGLGLSTEQRRANQRLSRAKASCKADGKLDRKALNVKKKQLGIAGKVNWKKLSLAWANERFGLKLLAKDHDVADALCLGAAYFAGVAVCDGLGNR